MRVRISRTRDVRLLAELDSRIFSADDAFGPEAFAWLTCFLVRAGNDIVGSVVFQEHATVAESYDAETPAEPGTLYLVSTGILPAWQGRGIGHAVKAWQLAYARRNGFRKIVTNHRITNTPIIHLNEKFGFRKVRTIPGYYHGAEDAVVMELLL